MTKKRSFFLFFITLLIYLFPYFFVWSDELLLEDGILELLFSVEELQNTWFSPNISTWTNTQTWVTVLSDLVNWSIHQQEVGVEIIQSTAWFVESTTWKVIFEELFPKDTLSYGEYIVLSFLQSYSGSLHVVWLGNWSAEKVFSLQAKQGERILITDTPQKFTNLSGYTLFSTSSITLTDNGEILEVWIDGVMQDTLIYTTSSSTQALVWWNTYNNLEQKQFTVFQEPLKYSIVLSWGQFGSWEYLLTWDVVFTWWQTTSGDVGPPWTFLSWTNILSGWLSFSSSIPFRIEEVYPFVKQFPEYIELLALEKFSGLISLYWVGVGNTEKVVFIETLPGIKWIITKDASLFPYTPFVLWVSWFSLSDSGEELGISTASWQKIDSIVYSWQHQEKALLYKEKVLLSWWEVRWFFTEESPTPWYTLSIILHHIPPPFVPPTCGIHLQHNKPFYAHNKVNIQAVLNSNFLANSSSYTCERLFSWADVLYNTWCNPSYISFLPGIYPVYLRIYNEDTILCELTEDINIPVRECNEPITDKKQWYYQELYSKRKEKYESLLSSIKKLWFSVNGSGWISGNGEETIPTLPQELLVSSNTWPPQIRIHYVLPNPTWKDVGHERLLLENITSEPISTDDILLARSWTTKSLPWWILLLPHQPQELKGDLWLPNKPACIYLRYRKEKKPLGVFCYPKLKEDELFTWWLVSFVTNQQQEQINTVSLILENNQSCVYIAKQKITCTWLPYPIQEAKQRKKDVKKLVSLQKKVVTLQWKYELWRTKYASQSQKNKYREQEHQQKTRTIKEQLVLAKKEKSIFRDLYWLLRNTVLTQWSPISSSSSWQHIHLLYTYMTESKNSGLLAWIQLPIDNVESIYKLIFAWELPLEVWDTHLSSHIQDTRKTVWKTLSNFFMQ